MAESVTLLALPQLVDLSLNAHEGVLNFQVLHTLLHIMIQQLSAQEIGVEFRGADSEHIQKILASTKPMPQGLYPEYLLVGEKGKKKAGRKISLQDVVKDKQNNLEEKKDRRKGSKADSDANSTLVKSPSGSLAAAVTDDLQTVVVVKAHSNLPQFSVAMSKTTFDGIQNDIVFLKEKFNELAELPGNLGLIKSARDESAPILDMFQILKLTKRMDASDQAIEKMGSLIEDLAKRAGDDIVDKLEDMKGAIHGSTTGDKKSTLSLTGIEERVTNLEDFVNTIREGGGVVVSTGGRRVSINEDPDTTSNITSATEDEKSVRDEEKTRKSTGSADVPYPSTLSNIDISKIPSSQALLIVQQEFEHFRNWIIASIKELKEMKSDGGTTNINTQVVDSKFKDYGDQLEQMNILYKNQIGALSDQFNNLQREIEDITTKLLPGGDSTGINAETTMELDNKLGLLQEQLVALSEQAEKWQKEKEQRDKQTEAIMEQLDVLKIVKANREDLEDALGEKADACMINRKVSHDQFDAACDDLSRGIEEALSKLEEQEDMWHQALQAIQREVGNKLDKMEVDPIRDFVNNKLKALQEKFKSLTALKKEQEAAGTKMKLLKNVNCISCDKDVVMRKEMDPTLKPQPYAMPPARNMAPYLAYELDQLRKQQKCVPGSKNLNFIENALKTRGAVNKDHVCNRYCGGSHTLTTPQQRVTRLGHFLEQWGPEIAPLQDEYVRGSDNRMYKSRDEQIYKKMGKGHTRAGVRSATEPVPVEDELPQQDRTAIVSPLAKEMVAKDVLGGQKGKNPHNIGSLAVTPDASPTSEPMVKIASGTQVEQPPN